MSTSSSPGTTFSNWPAPKQFETLQNQTIKNAGHVSERFKERGSAGVPFGGTKLPYATWICRPIVERIGTSLSGDQAARILDLRSIVLTRKHHPR